MGSVREGSSKLSTLHICRENGQSETIKRTSISQQKFFKTISGWFEVWMPWQRQVLLCGITNRCSPKQLEYLATALEPVLHRDFLASHSGHYPTELMFRTGPRSFPTTDADNFSLRYKQFAGHAHEKALEDFAAKYVQNVMKTVIRLLDGANAKEKEDHGTGHSPGDMQLDVNEETRSMSVIQSIQQTDEEKVCAPMSESATSSLSDRLPEIPMKFPVQREQFMPSQSLLTQSQTVLPPLVEVSSTSLVASDTGVDVIRSSQQSSKGSSGHERFRTHPPDSHRSVEKLSLSLLNRRPSPDANLDQLSSRKLSNLSWCLGHRATKCSSAESDGSSHKHKSASSSQTASTQDFFPADKLKRLGPYLGNVRSPSGVADVPVQKSYKPSRLWNKNRGIYKRRLIRANRLTMKQHFTEQINTIWQWMSRMKDYQRLDFLADLLKICEQDLLNYFSKCLIKRLQECLNINNMSDKLLLNIFSFLPVEDLKSACLVCRRWNYIGSHDELWRQKVLELGLMEGILNLDDVLVDSMNDNSIDWKAAYEELLTVIEGAKQFKSPQQKLVQVKDELRNYFEYRVQEFLARIRPRTQEEVEETLSSPSPSPEQFYKGTRRASGVVELPVTFMTTTQSQIDAMTGMGEDESETQTPEEASSIEGVMGVAETRMKRKEQMSKAADFALDVRPDPVQAADLLSGDPSSGRPTEVYPGRDDSIKPIKRVRRLQGHMDAVCTLMFDRRRIITGSMDHSIRVWDIRSGRSIKKIYGHMGGIRCLQFNDSYIISGSWDMSVRVWDIVRFTEVAVLTGHMGVVSCLQFSQNLLVTGSHDKTIRVWSMSDFSCARIMQHHKGAVTCLVFHTDQFVVSGSTDRTVKLSDVHTGECIMSFMEASQPISALHVRGNLILGTTVAGQLFCWRQDTGEVVAGLQLSSSPIYKILFMPDTTFGPRFLIGLGDGSIQEWDLVSMTCLRALYGHKGAVRDVQSSSDRIVSCSEDGNVRIWDLMPPSLRVGDKAQQDTIATTTIHQRRETF